MSSSFRSVAFVLSGLLAAPGALAADRPGQHFNIAAASLPPPHATPAVDDTARVVARPPGALPEVPPGFSVSLFASGLGSPGLQEDSDGDPRFLAVAPNGDLFVSESDFGTIAVLRMQDARPRVFAKGFHQPHGLAFHNGALYVADTEAVWRLGYRDGAVKSGRRVRVTRDSFGPKGGHFTRDIAFGPDGALYLAIGSHENLGEDAAPRATVQRVSADGQLSTFASGLRNPVGIAFYPGTNALWVTVNERDGLGDDLPPDYLARIAQGDFFGWPYAYTGTHPDPDFGARRPDLVARSKMPDLLFQAHSAPLGLVFYDGTQFPPDYRGDAFVALHGSWNSSKPTGYKVVRVRFKDGRPVGGYDNFLTGFRVDESVPATVWGRPVGLAVAKDGSLLVSDDAGKAIWRVTYTGR